jgi:hypothetical protein
MQPAEYFQHTREHSFNTAFEQTNLFQKGCLRPRDFDFEPEATKLSSEIARSARLQQDYIESLKLQKTWSSTFQTLQKALEIIAPHVGSKCEIGTEDMFDSYQCLKDISKRKRMLEKFNSTFVRVAEHVSDLASFLTEKE